MNRNDMKMKKSRGFTLIELLVVIAIIGLLSAVVLASLNTARAKARDAKRVADMVQVRTALELYYNDNGKYPSAYPANWGGVSTGTCGSANGGTSGASAYISGMTPTYIPTLPADPGTAGNCNGYLYSSNGANYKFLVHASFEGTYPTAGQAFYDPVRPTWALMVTNKNDLPPSGCGGGDTTNYPVCW